MVRKPRKPLSAHEKKRLKEIREASQEVFESLKEKGLTRFHAETCKRALRGIAAKYRAVPGSDQYLPFLNQVLPRVRNFFQSKTKKSRLKKVGIITVQPPRPDQADWRLEAIGNPN